MQKTLLFFAFLLFSANMSAQKLKITKFELASNDATARTLQTQKKDYNGEVCALVKVKSPVPDMFFKNNAIIAQEKTGASEFYVFLSPGARRMEVQAEGYTPITLNFADYGVDYGLESKQTYILELEKPVIIDEKAPFFKPTGVYIGGSYALTSLAGAAVHAGVSYKKIDLELSYRFGLSASDAINWYSAGENNAFSSKTEYKMSAMTAKLGYHLNAHRRLLIVPQAGISLHKLSANVLEGTNNLGDGTTCLNAAIGAKLVYSPLRKISLFAAPELDIPVNKTDTYQKIADAAGFSAGGFCCNIGVLFHF